MACLPSISKLHRMQRKPDGSLIGHKGVQYGLVKSTGPAKKAALVAPRPPNIFGDDDSDDDVEAQVARQADKKRSAAKVQQQYEAALAEDPTVFDYDGVYDSIQAARTQPKQQEKIDRRSRYIAQLKEQADQRKREEDIRFERRQLKERQQEDHLFEGKDKFITSGYRKKLEEDKKWMEDQQRKEEEEERNDVRKVGHMGNFYANLLTKNVAMGTAKTEAAKPKAEDAAEKQSAPGQDQPPAAKPAPKGPPLDKYEQMRVEAERARREAAAQGAGGAATKALDVEQAGGEQGQQGAGDAAGGEARGGDTVVEAAQTEAEEVLIPTQPAPAAGKRRNDDESILSARERYLARKKQQQGK